MAGMEQLEIHSRSYLVRWVDVHAGNTISWSIQPQKKSINFALFKHPGTASTGGSLVLPSVEHSVPATPGLGPSSNETEAQSTVVDKLNKLGMTCIAWVGRCEPNRVTMGSHDVLPGQSGMYGLVFDNTYSKQTSKTVTFVLMSYPSTAPPHSGHHLHFAQATARQSAHSLHSNQSGSPRIVAQTESVESLHDISKVVLSHPEPRSGAGTETKANGDTFYTGELSKKRRKRNQGHARRFFSLDFTSATLSYYRNRSSSALRGAVPLSMAVIATDEKSRTISIDSGTDVWLLRAHNVKDFEGWRDALERASNQSRTASTPRVGRSPKLSTGVNSIEQQEWQTVESLVGRVAGITDAVRRMAKDTDPKEVGIKSASTTSSGEKDYFQDAAATQKPSFWRRKSQSSPGLQQPPSNPGRRSISGRSLAPPSPLPLGTVSVPKTRALQDEDVHSHCVAVLRDLDAVVAQFASLIQENKQRRIPERPTPISRHSVESARSQEFFDADDGGQFLKIRRGSESPERPTSIMNDSASDSDNDDEDVDRSTTAPDASDHPLFPPRSKSLSPLTADLPAVKHRSTIPASTGPPPSLISFLRKNVGKDLTQIAMPVTANEPLSLLQRQAELLEYSSLLDAAATSLTSQKSPAGTSSASLDDAATQRLLFVTAFAISSLSSNRDKSRATRKPFNPLLGETYELVRPDLGWRFMAEKVSHRPVRVACAAESAKGWAFATAVAPDQKFWGKSAEIITDGRVRISLFSNDGSGHSERYSWIPPTCFLRNIIAGEKYVEPVGTFNVNEETSGRRAIVTFKAGGVFSGRSEEVSVRAFAPDGTEERCGLAGKWTQSLSLTPAGDEIWRVGAMVSPEPASRFGLTAFAASLNEVTALEDGKLPPTDSRLRPDQRAYENGRTAEAETLKAALEERQRERRKDGSDLHARWFVAVDADGAEVNGAGNAASKEWRRRDGDDEGNYWRRREGTYGWGGERARGDIFKA